MSDWMPMEGGNKNVVKIIDRSVIRGKRLISETDPIPPTLFPAPNSITRRRRLAQDARNHLDFYRHSHGMGWPSADRVKALRLAQREIETLLKLEGAL